MDLMIFEKINRLNNPYTDLGLEVLDKIITNEFKNAELDLRRRDQELKALELSHRMDEARRNYEISIRNKILEEKYKDMLHKIKSLELQNAQDEITAQNFVLEKGVKTFEEAKRAEGFEALPQGVKAIINKNAMRENAQIKLDQMQNQHVLGLMKNVINNPEIFALTKGNPNTFFEMFYANPEFAEKVILTDRNQRFVEIAAKNNVRIDDIQDLLDNPNTSDAQFWSRVQKLKEDQKVEQAIDYKNLLEQPVSYEDVSGVKNTTANKLLADYFYLLQSKNKDALAGVETAIRARPDIFRNLISIYPQLENVFKQPETQAQETDKTSVSIQGKKTGNSDFFDKSLITTPSLMNIEMPDQLNLAQPSTTTSESLKIGDIDISKPLSVKEKVTNLPIDSDGNVDFSRIEPYQRYRFNDKTVYFTEEDLEKYAYYYNKYKNEKIPVNKKREINIKTEKSEGVLEIPTDKEGNVDFDKIKPFQKYKFNDAVIQFKPEEIATYKTPYKGRVFKFKPEQLFKEQ